MYTLKILVFNSSFLPKEKKRREEKSFQCIQPSNFPGNDPGKQGLWSSVGRDLYRHTALEDPKG